MASDEDMANARPIVDVPSDGAGGDMVSRRRPSRFIARKRRRRETPRKAARAVEWNAPRQIRLHATRHRRSEFSSAFCRHIIVSDRPLARSCSGPPTSRASGSIIRDARRRSQAARRFHVVERRRLLPRDASRRIAAGRAFARTLSRAPPRARRGPRIERRLGPVRGDSLERLERRVRGVVPFAPSIRRPSSSRGDRRRLRRAVHRAEARRAGRVEGRSPPARHPRRSRRAVRVQAPALRARQRDHEGVGGVPHLRGPPRAHRHRISPRRRRVRATRRRRRRRRRRPPRRRDTAGVRLPRRRRGHRLGVESVPGAKDHAVPLSTLEDAQRLAGALRDAETKRLRSDSNPATYEPSFAVVGGGLSGVELAGVVAERMRAAEGNSRVELLASSAGIMPESPVGQREAAMRRLESCGVTIRVGARATRVGAATTPDPLAPARRAGVDRGGRRTSRRVRRRVLDRRTKSRIAGDVAVPAVGRWKNSHRRDASGRRTVSRVRHRRRRGRAATRPRRRTILSPVVTWPRRLTPRLRPARPCRAPRRWRSSRRITRRGTCGLRRLVGRSCRFGTSTSAT